MIALGVAAVVAMVSDDHLVSQAAGGGMVFAEEVQEERIGARTAGSSFRNMEMEARQVEEEDMDRGGQLALEMKHCGDKDSDSVLALGGVLVVIEEHSGHCSPCWRSDICRWLLRRVYMT